MSSQKSRWAVALVIVAVVGVGVGVGVCYKTLHARYVARGLHSDDPDVREEAADALAGMGLLGRLELLRAVRSSDEDAAWDAQHRLLGLLNEDLESGRSVERIVRAAIEGIDDLGEAGHRCAGVASAGWDQDWLDQDTKERIVGELFALGFAARPKYPVGLGGPRYFIKTFPWVPHVAYSCDVCVQWRPEGPLERSFSQSYPYSGPPFPGGIVPHRRPWRH